MSDIFQEVDEELREENYKSIWHKYKYYVIGSLLIFILGVALNAFWKDYSLGEVNDRSKKFFAALEAVQEDKIGAITLLENFSKEEGLSSEYNGMIARFSEASIRRSEKEIQTKPNNIQQTLAFYNHRWCPYRSELGKSCRKSSGSREKGKSCCISNWDRRSGL